MALLKLSAREALENRELRIPGWGRRSETNRIEPVALPHFDAPFQLEADEAIYVTGSCSARTFEAALREYGFRTPARQLFYRDEFRHVSSGVMNNFGVASVANEFAWALDPETPYDFDQNILEVAPNEWIDLHVIPSIKPRPREEVISARKAMIEVTKSVRDCRVVIMMFGQNELWFDTGQQLYLNAPPNWGLLDRFPHRFEWHVLDFEQTRGFIQRSVDLLKAHCRADQQILLVVAPGPLHFTLRPIDVMVANSYSKACLRTAVEHVCMTNTAVHYYPHYEAVTLSDRALAWEDDLVHARPEILKSSAKRLMQAFMPANAQEAALEAQAQRGDFSALEDEAARLATADIGEAARFYDRFGAYGQHSARFADLAAQHFLRARNPAEARRQFDFLPPAHDDFRRILLQARLLDAEKRHAEAAALLLPMANTRSKRPLRFWTVLISSLATVGRTDEAWASVLQWSGVESKRLGLALTTFAHAAMRQAPAAAADAFTSALREMEAPDWRTRAGLVEALILAGRQAEAASALEEMVPQSDTERKFHERMTSLLTT